MPILLFLAWLMFSERITVDVIVVGVIAVALLTFILHRIGVYDPGKDVMYASRILPFFGFVLSLVVEVFKANIHMIMLVLSPRPEEKIDPCIVAHKTKLRTPAGLVGLANSITLTPGTVTVDVGDDCVYVHAIDAHAFEGLQHNPLERQLERMEGSV